MSQTRPIEDLRNYYDEISDLCHQSGEPVYLTSDGKVDLVAMSIETYERLFGPVDLSGDTK